MCLSFRFLLLSSLFLSVSIPPSLEIILAAIQARAMPGITEEFANIHRGIFIINEVVQRGRGDRYLASSSKS